jgi:ribonuclease-3
MPPTTHRDDSGPLAECQKILGYRFGNLTLLKEALVHASGADHRLASNERLEFLGDAI